MISYLEGIIKLVEDRSLVMLVNGIGFQVHSPEAVKFTSGKQAHLFTYMHWSADNGPSLYGFSNELMRTLFLLIIDCPKIGPSIALSILASITPSHLIEAITSQNYTILSDVNGIGEKKAELIVTHLKHKVPKMILKGDLAIDVQNSSHNQWYQVSEALVSLNYSRQEISSALNYLTEKYAGQQTSLDQLIRAGLSYLSKDKLKS